MGRGQQRQSARSRVKELVMVFLISITVIALVLHYALSGFDITMIVGEFVPIVAEYPFIRVLVVVPLFVYLLATVRDYFAPG